jgi:hypothetical protein
VKASLAMSDKKAHVDYTASAAMTRRDFNVTLYDTLIYTSCVFDCICARDIPNKARLAAAAHGLGARNVGAQAVRCRARRFRRRSGRQFDFFGLPNNV